MSYSETEVAYEGGDKIFALTFPYIKKEHIEVTVNGVVITDFEFLNETQLTINTELTIGDKIHLKRITPMTKRMVVFAEGSILKKDSLNLAQEQLFYTVQEVYDDNKNFKDNTSINIDETINTFKDEFNTDLTTYKTEINSSISGIDTKVEDFKTAVNNQLDIVYEAAENINTTIATVEQAIITCTDKAEVATTKAEEAIAASAQAQSTANSLNGMVDTIATIESDIQRIDNKSLANTSLDNLDAAGKAVLDAKEDKLKPVSTKTGVDITLDDNSIHKVDITENTAFLLPTITADEKFHQILVQITMPEVKTIALGTTHFYNEEAPDMSEVGSYDLIYEHNGTDWVVGAIKRN